MYDVTIRDEPARRLALIRHRGPYIEVGQAFEKAGATVMARGLGPHLGAMIGLPLAGEKMLFVASIRVQASTWASRLSGRCTAIWSPSKSALKPAHTRGCSRIALPGCPAVPEKGSQQGRSGKR